MPISIKFPFQETTEGGVFKTNKSTVEAIQTNLISLLTTKRRNRVMNNNLFSPLWDYIFEPWDDISEETLRHELIEKIAEYIVDIQVTEIIFEFIDEQNLLNVKIVYEIVELGGMEDSVSVAIPVEPGSSGDEHHN